MRNLDWLIFFVYLALTMFLGVWKSRKGDDIDAYYLGDRSIPWWAAGLSVMATQASAITFVGTTGQAFNDGMRFIQVYLPLPFVVVILCVTFVPFFYRARVYTAYEYLERRFDTKTRALTSFLFQCSRAMAVGIVIYAPSVVLSAILGWNEDATVLLMGATTLAYTAFGGVRAVVWTDTMQMLLMFLGVFVGLYLVVWQLPDNVSVSDAVYLGGVTNHWNAIDTSLDLNNRYTLLSGLFGGFFLMLSYFGCDQSQVQRYITARSLKESRLSLVMTAVLKVPMQFLILATGVFLLIFYQFERPPVFFNPTEIRKIEGTPAYDEFLKKQEAFNTAFEERKAISLSMLEARKAGNTPEAERLLAEYKTRDTALNSTRKDVAALLKAQTGTGGDVNYVFPNFLLNYVPIGILGLMISVIFAAAMSTISAEIAALSSASMVDFYKRYFKKVASESHYLRASRITTLLWGAFATMVAIYTGRLSTSLIETVNTVGSHFYGPILGVFVLGFFVKRANGHGAFAGVIMGMAVVAYVSWATNISWLYYNAIGPFVVLIVGLIVSLLVPQPGGGSHNPPAAD